MKFKKVFRPLGLSLLVLTLVVTVSNGQLLLFGAKEKGKKYGYINERGDYVIAPAFDDAGFFNKGAAVVKQGKKFGIINEQGQFIVQPIYDGANYYAPEAKFTVKKGTKWGVVNAKGEEIIPFQYDFLSVLKDGYIVGAKPIAGKPYKNRACPIVLNEQNEIVFGPGNQDQEEHDCTQLFLPGYVDFKTGTYSTGWPMVRDGWLVLKEAWEGVQYAQIKLIEIKAITGPTIPGEINLADSYYGFREGTIAFDQPYSNDDNNTEYTLTENGAEIPKNALWRGLYYDTAKVRSGFTEGSIFWESGVDYQRTHPFFNGVAAVEKDNAWAFIDRDGWLINETQLSVKDFKAYPPMYFNGLIGFFKNGKAGYVDITGKEVIPFTLDEYHPFEYTVTPVKKDGLYGLLRKDGSWAVAPKFEQLFLSPCPCYQ